MANKRIVFTGGGTTGHVTLNLSLIPLFLDDGWEVYYIGSKRGIEKELVEKIKNVKYISIPTGKLRRYFDLKNVTDIFNVLAGCVKASHIIRKIKPSVVFSKGGFVSFPVVFGAKVNNVPAILHESDYTPGMANRLSSKFANTICTTFEKTKNYLDKNLEIIHTGPVVRPDILRAKPDEGYKICNFKKEKPVLMAIGGSLGARSINNAIRENLDKLLETFQIVHICGKGNLSDIKREGYVQFEYVKEEFADLLSICDIVVSRAGANAIFEFLFAQKPMLLIPLTQNQSRGDQIENAKRFEKLGYAKVLDDELAGERLYDEVIDLYQNRKTYIENMKKAKISKNALEELFSLIKERAR